MTHAHVLVPVDAPGTSCDDVTVVMTTAVGVACFAAGVLTGVLVVRALYLRRPSPAAAGRYFVSKTNVYGVSPTSTLPLPPLPSPDCGYSSLDADDVFQPASPHQLTVSDAAVQKRLVLRSTGSFRSMRAKLDSLDAEDQSRI